MPRRRKRRLDAASSVGSVQSSVSSERSVQSCSNSKRKTKNKSCNPSAQVSEETAPLNTKFKQVHIILEDGGFLLHK